MSPSIVPRHNGFGDGELLQDETRPLLYDVEDASRQRQPSTPLPKQQLGALCFIRLADPVAFTQIFPYVNEMMEKFGIAEPSQTGFYSGLVESVFAFAQLLSIYHWANLSDKLGRRPIVLLGTFGIAISTIWLGFSRTLSGVLLSRALAGLFSGNVAVMHSVLGEITDSSNQALAYPIYGLCWPLGVILGPLIGGTFANAAQKYPTWFGTYFFDQFPYFLPCFVVACATILTVVVGYFCLNEVRLAGCNPHYQAKSAKQGPSARSLLRIPVIRAVCLSGCALSFVGSAFDVVFVLFCYSPVNSGGLSFSVSQIGYALAIAGVSSAMIQIIFMPILLRRVSCARLYKTCMGIWPLAFLSLPPLNWVARTGFDDATQAIGKSEVNLLLWLGIGTALALSRVACLAFSLNMILVKEHAPGPSSLGSANGLAQFSQCFARAIAPAFVSCLYAFSVDHNILGGNLWVILMFAFSTLAWLHSAIVPDDPHATAGDISTNMLASH
ncbi:MFS general substrate transporter [Fomitiporia mediterranea MF3/22]|uniref:MFS general substrate transporter n=1 Tax=Fomitiporia mediterranea (strain MF3/22) TaxID=694068 RepID=UPI000440782B|nr:MFS general substrate transporter [Fomitiporia mediterranea MF3/22]EJD05792.1 MFS general substrate transporter [Fomitiporia mediterranea MF3/22]